MGIPIRAGSLYKPVRSMAEILQQLINGLSLGSIYALIALGYTMVYGVLRFINFAHSDVFMVGAFAGFYLSRLVPKESLLGGLAVMAASMALCAVLGILIERLAYRPLRARSKLSVLITAIGVSLLLENAGQFIFSANPRRFPTLFPETNFQLGIPPASGSPRNREPSIRSASPDRIGATSCGIRVASY